MMQSKWNRIQSGTARGTWIALLSVLIISLFAATAKAQAPIIVSQTTQYAALPAGGPFAGEDPVGSSWGINSKGVAVVSSTYGGNIYQYAPPTYAATLAGPLGNASGVAIDNNGYLFVSGQYSNSIVKFPMNPDGTYTWTSDPTASGNTTPTCVGDSKAPDNAGPCLITSLTASGLGYFGVVSMAFDSSNVLYFATDDQGANQWSIFQCKNPCAYPASGTTATDPTLIYAEPVTPTTLVATQGQLIIGSMAFDPWGNLFFTDAAVWGSAPNSGATSTGPGAYLSNLNELPVVTAKINPTKFAAAPLVILTETNTPPINDYNDAIVGVSIASNGNVYVSLVNSGIYGLTSNGSLNGADTGVATVSSSSLYGISNQGTKLLANDNNGNFYAFTNSGKLDYIYTGPVRFPGPVTVGTAETVNVVVADNTELCNSATLTLTGSSADFTAAATTGTTCANMSLGPGSLTPETLTYTPAATGFVPGTITVADGTSSASATQSVASAGQVLTISQATFGHKLLNGGAWGGTSPGGTSSALTSSTSPVPGVFIVGSSYGNDIEEFSALAGNPTGTAVSDGALNGGGGVAIDSQGYLYMSNEYGNAIYKAPPNAAGSATAYGPWAADPSASGNTTPTCAGDGKTPDTAGICVIATNYQGSSLTAGTAALGFDKNDNLFIATSNNNATNAYSVFECGPTCLYAAADATLLFAEPVSPAATPQLQVGDIVVDPSLNVFFTDTMITPLASEDSLYSDLYELPYDSATSSYDEPPVLLETLTPVCAALAGCTYNNAINTVATDASGDVFFGTPYGGVYEIANNAGTLNYQFPLAIVGQATKIIVPDGTGNFYFVNYNGGGDTAGYINVGSVAITPTASVGTPSSVTNVTAVDNYAGCFTGQSDLTFTALNTDFSAAETPGSGCGTLPFGNNATFPVTVTYNPSSGASGPVTTTLSVTSAATSDTGTASVTGTAAVITAQTITPGNPAASETVTYGVAPIVLAATATSTLPVTFTIDAASTAGAATLAADGITLTINTPGTVIIDENQAGGASGGLTYGAAPQVQITITVDQIAQTITGFNPASPVYLGVAPITLTATGGASGNPVVFTLDSTSTAGAATLSGSTLTITGAGTVVIDANQDGNTDYAAAAQVQASIVVSSAVPQAIVFAPASPVTFGVAPITLTATGGASGNPVVFTLDSTSTAGAATLSGSTLTITGVGTVVIDANQAGGVVSGVTYAAAPQVQASIVVNQAAQTITFTNPTASETVTVGVAPIVLAATATSTLPVTFTIDSASTAGAATLGSDGVTLTIATAGTVIIDANQAGNANYAAATQVQITITVNPLAPTFSITASPTTATVTSTTPATITITVAPNATFTGAVTFACTGTGVTCAFNPATVTAPATSTTLTISKSTTAALHNGPSPFIPEGVTFAIALGFLGWKKRRGMFLALVVLASVICLTQLTACGGSSKGTTSTVTVTATGDGVTQTLPLTITVK